MSLMHADDAGLGKASGRPARAAAQHHVHRRHEVLATGRIGATSAVIEHTVGRENAAHPFVICGIDTAKVAGFPLLEGCTRREAFGYFPREGSSVVWVGCARQEEG